MTIFGQNVLLESFHSDTAKISLIKLLGVLWCPKHRKLSRRKFLSSGNTWKTMEARVFNIMLKSYMVAMATLMRAHRWKWNVLTGKLPERKAMKKNVKLQAVLKISCDFGKGYNVPRVWLGFKGCCSHCCFHTSKTCLVGIMNSIICLVP